MKWLPGSVAVLLAGVAVGALFDPTSVRAETVSVVGGVPVEVQADRLDVDLAEGTAVLRGNVRVVRQDLELRCERLDARYDKAPTVTWARASGGVVARLGTIDARAPEAELELRDGVVELRGGVKLSQGGTWVQAEVARLDLRARRAELRQVRGTIAVPATASMGGHP